MSEDPRRSFIVDPTGKAAPDLSKTKDAVRHLLAMHERNDGAGATLNLRFGDMENSDLFVVSAYPRRSLPLPGRSVDPEDVQDFITAYHDLLQDPRNNLGIWYLQDQDTTFLDVSLAVPEEEVAKRLGSKYNQVEIYYLGGPGRSPGGIATGGSGAPVPELEDLVLPAHAPDWWKGLDQG